MNVTDVNGHSPLHLAMGKSLERDRDDEVRIFFVSLFFLMVGCLADWLFGRLPDCLFVKLCRG